MQGILYFPPVVQGGKVPSKTNNNTRILTGQYTKAKIQRISDSYIIENLCISQIPDTSLVGINQVEPHPTPNLM